MPSFQDLENIEKVIGVLLGVVAALAVLRSVVKALYNKLLLPCIRFYKKFTSLFEFIEILKAQFLPNGGSSAIDSLKRIEARQCINEVRDKVILSKIEAYLFEIDKHRRLRFCYQSIL